jgi:hypothetical protein
VSKGFSSEEVVSLDQGETVSKRPSSEKVLSLDEEECSEVTKELGSLPIFRLARVFE